MESNRPDVQSGMDVYDSNQDKIGTVGRVNTSGPSAGTGGVSPEQRGGLLGNESAVSRSPGVGGGSGALGDESAVGRTPSTGAGTGTLGSESDVRGGRGSISGSDSTEGSGADIPAGELIVETIEVDVIPAGPGEGGQSGTMMSTPEGYEPNPFEGTSGYFTVDESAGLGGLIGMHGKTLDIPYAAIMSVDPGKSVTLSVIKDEAERLYSRESQTPTMNPQAKG